MRVLLLTVVSLFIINTSLSAQRNCGAMDHLHHQMEQDPKRATKLQQIENHTNYFIQNSKESESRDVITIPVVFHVVYNTTAENLSDARLQEQLDVLNADFRRLNSDADGTWSQAADAEIEFCLATVDPDGNATSGITRTQTSQSSFGTNDSVKFNSSGGKDAWPAGDYLNFWVCDISGSILGYAQFPGGDPATDGVVNDYAYTGVTGASAPFNLGRTATHEVGHWLNLRHIWGDGNCNVDDFVTDTPTSDAANTGCSTGHVSCGTVDMVQNYMDYSDDACMNLFTQGQKSRMLALFSTGGARESISSSNGCGSGNPPPPPPACDDNEVSITITFDNYPEETAWSITDASGATVASGGTYGSQADGSTLVLDECLVDGCYDFTITDTYGDGICCSYGNGSYSVTLGGDVLASGGTFGNSETTNICLGGGPPAPTCTDGVQNGNETGVDCGGPDCSPCPTCNDGVQNGSEIGIDCGGPDCAACPTCSDGVQNGSETGVDCGGPDCAACPTCNDGVQNGNETGVDCGGPDCSPCDTGGGCTENTVTVSITLDNYPEETAWSITDANGNTVASGGTYGSQSDGSTITEELCLADGCYDFTITDVYGDGICCSYGNGSYTVSSGGSSLASGGAFGSSETTNICLGNTPPAPTCDDGIQNGDETGIDCGGSCQPCSTGGSTELLGSYFETGLDGWIDGGSDCYRYAGDRSYEGTYSIRLRDNSGTGSSMTSPTLDLSGYNSVDVSFYFYPNSMETGEDFWLRYDDGSGWTTVATYASGSSFTNNSFYSATVTLSSADYNLASAANFRFQCDASANADRIYIDQVVITGNGAGSRSSGNSILELAQLEQKGSSNFMTDEMMVYPNPVSSMLHIALEEGISDITIRNTAGQVVSKKAGNSLSTDQIDVSELRSGIYLISITTEEEIVTTKFVKY